MCHDRTLWKIVDLRSEPTKMTDLKQYLQHTHPQTKQIAINGKLKDCCRHGEYREELKIEALMKISENCTNLKELIIEEYSFNSYDIKITDFPKTLEKLSLKGTDVCHLSTSKSYFFKMDSHMPNLTSLIVSNCQWLTGHSLLVISKIRKLKEFRMDSCRFLGDCVAYASLATRFGFKTLEILDLRRTGFGDSEIRSFSGTKTLTHLYLEYSPEPAEPTDTIDRRRHMLEGPQYEDRVLAQYALPDSHFAWDELSHSRISDASICALGSYVCDRRVLDDSAVDVLIEEEVRVYNNPDFKCLVVR